MPKDLLIHLGPGALREPERARVAIRFALVSMIDGTVITLLLSGDTVDLVATPTPPSGHRDDPAQLLRAFLDQGGRVWLMSSSAVDHGVADRELPDGASVVTPQSVTHHLERSTCLTF